jgi:hypothetical protein
MKEMLDLLTITTILDHFGEDAHGRDGYGHDHASKSNETLYIFSKNASPGKFIQNFYS